MSTQDSVPFLVRISRPLLEKFQKRFGMPDMGNAFDELLARSVTMESCRQVGQVHPPIQDADTAKTYYELDPNWMSMNSTRFIPEFKVRFSRPWIDQLARVAPFKSCGTYKEVLKLLLDRGMWGETTDDPRPQRVKGFGDVGGVLPISWKDVADKVDVELG